ncbi:MAG: alpha-L-fucosidase [Chthoniobacteraceae bacterium]
MAGPFEPTWKSLEQYRVPQWFSEAKFGIWAHWGAQCEPEHGDWYARSMYVEGSRQYKDHVAKYGPSSKIRLQGRHPRVEGGELGIRRNWWRSTSAPGRNTSSRWRTITTISDNWNSKYQPWNSVALGPKKDLIGGWAKAAREQGLYFGVSVHAAHAWSWYEVAQGGRRPGAAGRGALRWKADEGRWQGDVVEKGSIRRISTPKTTRQARTSRTAA